jgi:hypothetical protein
VIELDGYDLRVLCESLEITSEVKKIEVKQLEKQIKIERGGNPSFYFALIGVYRPF